MESAEKRDGHTDPVHLHRAADRGIFRESEMGTGAIVVVGVGFEDLAKTRARGVLGRTPLMEAARGLPNRFSREWLRRLRVAHPALGGAV